MKASDDFLDLIFPEFYRQLGLRPDFRKADYYQLVSHVPESLIAPEVIGVLDAIDAVASRSRPATNEIET